MLEALEVVSNVLIMLDEVLNVCLYAEASKIAVVRALDVEVVVSIRSSKRIDSSLHSSSDSPPCI